MKIIFIGKYQFYSQYIEQNNFQILKSLYLYFTFIYTYMFLHINTLIFNTSALVRENNG